MFFVLMHHDSLNYILIEGHQGGTFLPSYIEIGPVVSDKKIFKLFYIDI